MLKRALDGVLSEKESDELKLENNRLKQKNNRLVAEFR